MHITRLDILPYLTSTLGLEKNEMSDLGSLVVLVGENGCGKSRLLEAVDWSLRRTRQVGYAQLLKIDAGRAKQKRHSDAMLLGAEDHISCSAAASDCEAFDKVLVPLDCLNFSSTGDEDIDVALSAYCALSDILRNPTISKGGHFTRLSVGAPRGDGLTDSLLAGTPLAYIDDVCVRQAAASSDESIGMYSPNRMIEDDYARLKEVLNEITGMHLDVIGENACIGGQRIDRTTFSDGQMALLRIAVLIHSQVLKDVELPILLDEPERHLHPSRLIGLIDALRKHLPRAQLWIATHNLALTAHLAAIEPRAIWFGSNGLFERAGLAQEKVINGLLGGATGAQQISDFCTRADQFAACSFSADCLYPPDTVTYKKDDPQIQQIRDFITGGRTRPMVIVDIGAGQARLLDGLAHLLNDSLLKDVSYYAIEPNDATRALCAERVSRHFNDGSVRVFASAKDLLASGPIKADVAVLANVLHEIELKYWEAVLLDAHTLLEDDGSLLIVEDTRLPRGELAHPHGFLILETDALCELFATCKDAHGVQHIAATRGGARLQATAFKRPLLAALTTSSIRSALHLQKSSAAASIRELRKSGRQPDYRLGQEHAYHTQLLANLTLALEDLALGR